MNETRIIIHRYITSPITLACKTDHCPTPLGWHPGVNSDWEAPLPSPMASKGAGLSTRVTVHRDSKWARQTASDSCQPNPASRAASRGRHCRRCGGFAPHPCPAPWQPCGSECSSSRSASQACPATGAGHNSTTRDRCWAQRSNLTRQEPNGYSCSVSPAALSPREPRFHWL